MNGKARYGDLHDIPDVMTINPTYLAQRTRSCKVHYQNVYRRQSADHVFLATNWADAKNRVLKSYREWLRAVRKDTHTLHYSN